MSYTPRSLFRLLEDIDANRLLLPHIQRPFVWEDDQMIRLFDSLMREYPIQTFLFWRTKEAIRARRFMALVDRDADLSEYYDMARSAAGVEKVFVLDGQQRLQTLHTLFRGGVLLERGRAGEAYFDITSCEANAQDGDLIFRLAFESDRPPLPMFRIRDLSEVYANENPLSLADNLNDTLEQQLSEPVDIKKQRERQVRANLQQLYSILHHDKHFWVEELDGVAKLYPYRRILDVFVRVNSGGTKLSAGDLMFAAMKEGWEDVEQRVEQTVELLNDGRLSIDGDFVLKCLLLAHGTGSEVQTEKFYGPDGERFLHEIETSWERSEAAFRQLRDFLVHNLKIYSDRVIRTYNALIPIFDFLYHNPKPDEGNRLRMAAYYHKAQIFNWYSYQTDAVLNALHSVIAQDRNGAFPLDEIKDYFRQSRRATVELAPSHLDESRLRAILLNIVYAEGWGNSLFDVAYKGNEPHVDHIYPQYMLRKHLGCTSGEINDIGNLRFFGSSDNIRKRAELPASYFSRLKASGVPIEKHLLVREYADKPSALTFDRSGYDEFRQRRRGEIWRLLKRAIDPEVPVAEPALGPPRTA